MSILVPRRHFLAGLAGLSGLTALGATRARPAPSHIDVHCHYAPPAWTTTVTEKTARGIFGSVNPAGGIKGWTAASTLEQMDRAGIATSVLSVTTPGIWFGEKESPRELTRALARDCNEYGAKLMADHRGRFGLFAALPLPDVDASLSEIAYALDTLKAHGVGLLSHYSETYGETLLGDPAFAPVLAELNRRKAVVYVHRKISPEPYEIMGWDLHRAMLSLLHPGGRGSTGQASGAPRYPDIRFIFSHAGGTVPFLADRTTAPSPSRRVVDAAAAHHALAHLQHFYFDTGHSNNALTLAALKRVVPTSHILFGTDFPYSDLAAEVVGLEHAGVFTATECRSIGRDNALAVLPALTPSL